MSFCWFMYSDCITMFVGRWSSVGRMAGSSRLASRMASHHTGPEGRSSSGKSSRSGSSSGNHEHNSENWSWGKKVMFAPPVFCAATALGLGMYKYKDNIDEAASAVSLPVTASVQAAAIEYGIDEISKHKSRADGGIWVTYGDNVYDITTFVEQHPGGEKIMLAAGGPLEPFWKIYTIHTSNDCVLELLKPMMIGKIKNGETFEVAGLPVSVAKNDGCPYEADPNRHPAYTVNSNKPFDAEPPTEMLIHDLITPNEIFFVRNHLPVPKLDETSYNVTVEIKGEKSLSINLHDLKTKYKKHTVAATLQCAGNRRGEMGKFRKIYGALAGHAAISTAVWGGVKLRDVLLDAGISEDDPKIKHIIFEGWDKDPFDNHYGASIPIEKAMNSMGDVMLAYEMNGVDLPADHGYPVRVVCPGVIGARSVKWVKKISASEEECQSTWQKNDYRSTHPSATWNDFDTNTHIPIYEWPVQSVICTPSEGQKPKVHDGLMNVRGYAWSGGGNGIVRVDVSADQGKTWHSAELQQLTQRRYRSWAWTLWEADVPVPDGVSAAEGVQLWCKAVDSSHNVQPDSISGIWNLRGFLNNTWHRVKVIPDYI